MADDPLQRKAAPEIPDHELIRQIGGGSYGEVWPYEREFSGIRKFEPISRSRQRLVDIESRVDGNYSK